MASSTSRTGASALTCAGRRSTWRPSGAPRATAACHTAIGGSGDGEDVKILLLPQCASAALALAFASSSWLGGLEGVEERNHSTVLSRQSPPPIIAAFHAGEGWVVAVGELVQVIEAESGYQQRVDDLTQGMRPAILHTLELVAGRGVRSIGLYLAWFQTSKVGARRAQVPIIAQAAATVHRGARRAAVRRDS